MQSSYSAGKSPLKATPRGRRAFWWIFLAFAMPVVAAWLLYLTRDHWQFPQTNHGILIQPPRPLAPFESQTLDGKPLTLEDLKGYWILVYIGPPQCPEPCQRDLYKMRQVRLALGEDMRRVKRLFLVRGEGPVPVLAQHPGLIAAKASPDILQAFPEPGSHRIYLIDPLGNLFMYYPPDTDPKGMLKDLKRLLKLSRIG
ncbi:MAG: hypothetical protein D6819_03175 [Gammaproteobacteria bacterium]|nr:MAG: hypothetical protein D6819_03175 [Gammaproteobacteria bacterium]